MQVQCHRQPILVERSLKLAHTRQGWSVTDCLKSTVDPGGIPSRSSTIGGPKHLELSPSMSVGHVDQSGLLLHKAEGITQASGE